MTVTASSRANSSGVTTPPFQVLQNARWFQPILASATIALQSNSTQALLAAARAGAGIAVLPGFVARAPDDLVSVSDDVASHDISLITHPEVRRDPKVRATADFLKQLATDPPGLLIRSCPATDVIRPPLQVRCSD